MTPQPPKPQYRLYSFVAGLYLSPLQSGLQTAHAVSEMHSDLLADRLVYRLVPRTKPREVFDEWAQNGKTIIICNALNSAGVEEAYTRLQYFGEKLDLPITIFHEDEQSLNGAATATAVVVPEHFFDAKPHVFHKSHGFWKSLFTKETVVSSKACIYTKADGTTQRYEEDSVEYEFIAFLKSYRLA